MKKFPPLTPQEKRDIAVKGKEAKLLQAKRNAEKLNAIAVTSLSEITGHGRYVNDLITGLTDVLIIEHNLDCDKGYEYFTVHVGNFAVMQGNKLKRWKTMRLLLESLKDYAVNKDPRFWRWDI